ncbi:MAG: radical SAM family heme chaperone HemW [Bacteroidia bacterium]|nr:radical SAM family heme chaperone HemW [Bacteroidia bacterium]
MAGIYVHIPFCRQACTYCDFHFSTVLNLKKGLLEGLLHEISIRNAFFRPGEELKTLYFGGGTPSLLELNELEVVLDQLKRHFNLDHVQEITLEANPDDLSPAYVEGLRELGINRLSIGIQSFREDDLRLINRSHTASQSKSAVKNAKAAGFENISLDLIYGIPGLSMAAWEDNLGEALELKVPHISAYALTVEPKTALAHQVKTHKVRVANDEDYLSQFEKMILELEKAGLEHYELSNFARPGFRSRHNSSYWKGLPYLGLGPSAHSYQKGERSWNVANNALYIKELSRGNLPLQESEVLTPIDQFNEYVMTRLRISEGINEDELAARFGFGWNEEQLEVIGFYQQSGHILPGEGKVRLSLEGKFISDRIISELFLGNDDF